MAGGRNDLLYLSLWWQNCLNLFENLLLWPCRRWCTGLSFLSTMDNFVHYPSLHLRFQTVLFAADNAAGLFNRFINSLAAMLLPALNSKEQCAGRLVPLLDTALMLDFPWSSVLLDQWYLHSFTISITSPVPVVLVLLSSSSNQSPTLWSFRSRFFSLAHPTKSATTALYSSSRPSLIHQTTAESSWKSDLIFVWIISSNLFFLIFEFQWSTTRFICYLLYGSFLIIRLSWYLSYIFP